jgi:hypothetical protein
MEVLAAFGGALLAGVAAYFVARRQRGWDRSADRRAAEVAAVGQLAAAVAELRWEASRIAMVDDGDKYEEARKVAPIEGRMLAAHTAIYTASDDETLVLTSVGVVQLGRDLARAASAIPFDPAEYETLRSMFERTFRDLRQRARSLGDLPALEGEPTNETSDDYEGEGDPAAW